MGGARHFRRRMAMARQAVRAAIVVHTSGGQRTPINSDKSRAGRRQAARPTIRGMLLYHSTSRLTGNMAFHPRNEPVTASSTPCE